MARRAGDYKDDALRPHAYYDYTLLFLTIFLVCFGLVMIYSSSAYTSAMQYNGDSTHYLKQQGLCAILGVIAMLAVSKIPYRFYITAWRGMSWAKLLNILYVLVFGMLLYVAKFGRVVKGAKRWIEIGPISFQPSEFAKILTVLLVAYMIEKAPKEMDTIAGFVRVGLYLSPILVLIANENLSTAIIIVGIMVTMCFVSSRKKGYYGIVGAVGIAGIALYILGGWRSTRIDIWRNVETHPKGFQILQGLYAIASGGLFGTGLGQSMQKLGFIPEAHNDMIFSIICEELGLFGAVVIILIFVILIYRIFVIAISAPDLFGALICVGVMAQIAIQVILNIAVVTNTIPSTGVALPFISYGGTSVTILLAEMGLVLSVSNQIRHQK